MKQSVTVGVQLLSGGRYGCNKGRYGCTIVMSYIEINKAVSQWLLTLIHWGRVTHICVGKLTIINSDNGLSPGRRQAII